MAEWLGNGLQNRVQRFESAWYLKTSPLYRFTEGLFFSGVEFVNRMFCSKTQKLTLNPPIHNSFDAYSCFSFVIHLFLKISDNFGT